MQPSREMKSIALIAVGLATILMLCCDDLDVTVEGWPFPVGGEDQAVFDAGLIGVWRSVPAESESESEVAVSSRDGRTYSVIMRDDYDASPVEMSGFVVEAGRVRILNGRLVGSGRSRVSGYLLFRYQLEPPDGLVVMPLESTILERGVKSAEELFSYLQVHSDDTTLYAEASRYRRVSLWSRAAQQPAAPADGRRVRGDFIRSCARRR